MIDPNRVYQLRLVIDAEGAVARAHDQTQSLQEVCALVCVSYSVAERQAGTPVATESRTLPMASLSPAIGTKVVGKAYS